MNNALLNLQKLDVQISKEDQILIKESQSALVLGGILPLKFCESTYFEILQVMLQIGSKYKNPEGSKVLIGKTAVRENIRLKLECCKKLITEAVRHAGDSFSIVTDMTTDKVNQGSWIDLPFTWVENIEVNGDNSHADTGREGNTQQKTLYLFCMRNSKRLALLTVRKCR